MNICVRANKVAKRKKRYQSKYYIPFGKYVKKTPAHAKREHVSLEYSNISNTFVVNYFRWSAVVNNENSHTIDMHAFRWEMNEVKVYRRLILLFLFCVWKERKEWKGRTTIQQNTYRKKRVKEFKNWTTDKKKMSLSIDLMANTAVR